MAISKLLGNHLTAHDKKMITYGVENNIFNDDKCVKSPRKKAWLSKITHIELDGKKYESDGLYHVQLKDNNRTSQYIVEYK